MAKLMAALVLNVVVLFAVCAQPTPPVNAAKELAAWVDAGRDRDCSIHASVNKLGMRCRVTLMEPTVDGTRSVVGNGDDLNSAIVDALVRWRRIYPR